MNAKKEFLEEAEGKTVVCAKISFERGVFISKEHHTKEVFILKEHHTKKDYKEFLKKLDFEYDSGYGTQELFGIILFSDSYSTRREYDGSEWWANHKMPTPKEVIGDEEE